MDITSVISNQSWKISWYAGNIVKKVWQSDGQTDGRTDRNVLRAAWSQLKTKNTVALSAAFTKTPQCADHFWEKSQHNNEINCGPTLAIFTLAKASMPACFCEDCFCNFTTHGKGNWNCSPWKTRTCSSCIIYSKAADDLAMHGARALAAMIIDLVFLEHSSFTTRKITWKLSIWWYGTEPGSHLVAIFLNYWSVQIVYTRTRGPFNYHGLTLIPSRISNHMPSKVWHHTTYPLPNFNGATIEICQCRSDLVLPFIIDVITYNMIISLWFHVIPLLLS